VPVCVVMYCSVLQCVAVCCSVLQCVAVCCSVLYGESKLVSACLCVLQCVVISCRVLQCWDMLMYAYLCIAVCCSVLQCVAVCSSVLQHVSVLHCVAVCCIVLQYDSILTPRTCGSFQKIQVSFRDISGSFQYGIIFLLFVEVCCSVCKCRSVLQCMAACCRVRTSFAAKCVAVYCSLLQRENLFCCIC